MQKETITAHLTVSFQNLPEVRTMKTSVRIGSTGTASN